MTTVRFKLVSKRGGKRSKKAFSKTVSTSSILRPLKKIDRRITASLFKRLARKWYAGADTWPGEVLVPTKSGKVCDLLRATTFVKGTAFMHGPGRMLCAVWIDGKTIHRHIVMVLPKKRGGAYLVGRPHRWMMLTREKGLKNPT